MNTLELVGDVVLGASGEGGCMPYFQNCPDLWTVTHSDLTDGWSPLSFPEVLVTTGV